MDIAELEDPVAVWKAVEGDMSELIALLRSDRPIRRRTREALADFLAGDLKPIDVPKGRPSKSASVGPARMYARLWHGHDVTTSLGYAGFRYERLRRFIRSKGWHRGNPGWSDWLKAAIANRQGVELERFANYLRRSRPEPELNPWSWNDYVTRRRTEIAREVRRAKIGTIA